MVDTPSFALHEKVMHRVLIIFVLILATNVTNLAAVGLNQNAAFQDLTCKSYFTDAQPVLIAVRFIQLFSLPLDMRHHRFFTI